MQNANELLYSILQIVGKIEANQRQQIKTSSTPSKPSQNKSIGDGSISTKLKSVVDISKKDKTVKNTHVNIEKTHKSIPSTATAIQQHQPIASGGDGSISSRLGASIASFSGIKASGIRIFFRFLKSMLGLAKSNSDKTIMKVKNLGETIGVLGNSLLPVQQGLVALGKVKPKQVDSAINSLTKLYNFMFESGGPKKARVNSALKTFEKMGQSLKKIAKPIKDISLSFAYLGLGILALAGSLILTTMLLKLAKPSDILLFIGFFVLGIVAIFGILWLTKKIIDKGAGVLKDIGLGMAALSLGILSFAITIVLIPKIFGGESGGSIAKSLLIMVGIVMAIAVMFIILGAIESFTKKGFMSILFISAGIMVLSLAILSLAFVAKQLMTGMSPAKASKDEKDDGKKAIMNGLGVIGLIVLASVALMAFVGIPAVAALVALGSVTMILLSVTLIVMAKSIESLMGTAKKLDGVNIEGSLTTLIGGTLNGFLGGISALSDGQTGVSGVLTFIKNSAKIFAATGVLMAMSLAIGTFAWAISAFAELENLRVITGYDKDNKPIFGDKINVIKVSENISTSISGFLNAMLASTKELTLSKAVDLMVMGEALTGKSGILSAIIMFADVLKTFAQFGPNGEIGYVEMVEDGKDANGNIKYKQKLVSVKITDVVTSITSSFIQFVGAITKNAKSFELDGEQGKAMMELSSALIGTEALNNFGITWSRSKPGLLVGISKFSEILSIYGKYGKDLKIPKFDKDGNEIAGAAISVEDVADNIIKSLSVFITRIGDTKVTGDVDKAVTNLSSFSDIIDTLKDIADSTDGLTRFSKSIGELATNIGLLSTNLSVLDVDKVDKLSNASAAYLAKTNNYANSNARIMEGSTPADTTSATTTATPYDTTTKTIANSRSANTGSSNKGYDTNASTTAKSYQEADWSAISSQIGQAVGNQIVAAMKSGHLKFEFSSAGGKNGVLEFD